MRSDLIYRATRSVPNRYKLCQVAAKATRKFHRPNTRVQETMNDVLARFGRTLDETQVAVMPEKLAEPQRRAA